MPLFFRNILTSWNAFRQATNTVVHRKSQSKAKIQTVENCCGIRLFRKCRETTDVKGNKGEASSAAQMELTAQYAKEYRGREKCE
ncbi:MAG: hypothetical protein HQM08_26350 [Candidatus Riflebacteria bacterium]|nr:hypothetical protein [Candidatus Riflebacteria bacterium]